MLEIELALSRPISVRAASKFYLVIAFSAYIFLQYIFTHFYSSPNSVHTVIPKQMQWNVFLANNFIRKRILWKFAEYGIIHRKQCRKILYFFFLSPKNYKRNLPLLRHWNVGCWKRGANKFFSSIIFCVRCAIHVRPFSLHHNLRNI